MTATSTQEIPFQNLSELQKILKQIFPHYYIDSDICSNLIDSTIQEHYKLYTICHVLTIMLPVRMKHVFSRYSEVFTLKTFFISLKRKLKRVNIKCELIKKGLIFTHSVLEVNWRNNNHEVVKIKNRLFIKMKRNDTFIQ